MEKPYEMPQPFTGQIVLWHYQGHNDNIFPAMVIGVPNYKIDSVKLLVFRDGLPPKMIPGARHVTDPGFDFERDREKGTWDFCPFFKAYQELLGYVKILESKVEEMEKNLLRLKKAKE